MKIPSSMLFVFFVVFFFFDGLYAAENEWELLKDEKGIQLYRRSVKGSEFDEFKGVMVINTRIEVIAAVLRDPLAYPKWMSGCKKSQIIEQFDENNMIVYHVQNTKWPLKDRDVVLKATTSLDWKAGWFRVELISIEDSRVPPKETHVRMVKMNGNWFAEYLDREHTRVTFIFTSDPGGSLPASLVNKNIKTFPYNTLRGMKGIVQEPKYIKAANSSKDREILKRYIAEGRLRK
jgi:hypothetical protein